MRIITLNVNGIRSAAAKGPVSVAGAAGRRRDLPAGRRALEHQFEGTSAPLPGYHESYYAGGTAWGTPAWRCISRHETAARGARLRRGRVRSTKAVISRLQFRPSCRSISLYAALGLVRKERQASKDRFLNEIHAAPARAQAPRASEYIICGDWNIAHKAIDLRNWKSNQKNPGFLPEERAWLDQLFDEPEKYIDAFRCEPGAGSIHLVVATAARRGRRMSAGASIIRY
jgi:exodeoxyribonuclease-3